MDGNELTDLIAERSSTLRELLESGNRQMAAIDGGHMSELMRILSQKQTPLNRLIEIASRIRAAAAEDPAERRWASESMQRSCRRQQEECEQMHLELLAMEAECETALQKRRDEIRIKIDRVDAARQAATGYEHAQSKPQSGSQLDLASD